MIRTCIVVADAGTARFLGVEESDAPRAKFRLVERVTLERQVDLKVLGRSGPGRVRTETNTSRGAGPVHPMGAQRERHRVELERRFAQDIADQVAGISRGWKEGAVVLVAERRLLGLMRGPVRKALRQGIQLKELAKDYARLTASELRERLVVESLLPAAGSGRGR